MDQIKLYADVEKAKDPIKELYAALEEVAKDNQDVHDALEYLNTQESQVIALAWFGFYFEKRRESISEVTG
ncbi:MAG: hypothetical protein Q4A10_06900 [Aerococcaceae bacterium]|nr:hypothetical protein [Aerococcaceae bacterium]